MARLRIGLRARLLLLGMVAALPALVLALDVGRQLQRVAADAALDSALHSLRQVAQAQERAIAGTGSLLNVLATMPEIRAGGDSCRRVLALVRADRPRYANLGVIGADGGVRCSVAPFDVDLDLSDRDYFQRSLSSRGFVMGRYQVDRLTRRPTLNMAYPVVEDGQVTAVVFAALDLAWLRELVATAELPPDSRISLLDPDGTLLARVPPDRVPPGQSPPEAAAIRQALGNRSEGTAESLKGADADHVYAYTLVAGRPGEDLLLYVAIPDKVVFADADRLLLRNLLGGIAVLLLVVGGAWVFSHMFILRRIQDLLTLTARIGRGDLAARSRLADDGSELGQLGRAFDDMAGHLQAHTAAMERQQLQINRLNRVYAVLSGINAIIIRAADAGELLEQACRIATEHGRFPLAWIALREADSDRIGQVWHAGDDVESAGELVPRQGNQIAALARLRSVFESGAAVIHNDIQVSSSWTVAARSAARRRGYGAAIDLPLHSGNTVVGCLCLYAREADFFSCEEVRLLKELAADVSLALGHIHQGERLVFLANRDPLTGLANGKLFQERLQQALHMLEHSGEVLQLAVLVITIDGLDEIGTLHGQHVSDQLLRESARRIALHVGGSDQVGRLGHTQFGALMPGVVQPETAASVAQKIIEEFSLPIDVDGSDLFLNVRVGISLAPDDGRDAPILIQHAGSAVASLRRKLGHYRFFTAQIHRQARHRLDIEHALRHALERDEFRLVYQPLVDIRTRRAIGVEVLLRWRHPQLGELSPTEFIPIAESGGSIGPIGEWVLKSACAQARAWADEGLAGLKVAVNVSVSQLRQPGFQERLEHILAETGAEPHTLSLGLEVTESELMEEAEHVIGLLNALRERGFALSIDDFGTGYSSLAYLRQLPVDTLKIDVSFVRDLERDTTSASIIDAIVALAHHLGLATVAEGVETTRQLELLTELGCDSVQGNIFSAPLSPGDVPARLRGQMEPRER